MDTSSFVNRIQNVKNGMYRLGLVLLKEVTEAEDALQDVLAKLWVRKDQEVENFDAYAMQTMKNHCLDKLRSGKNKKSVSLSEDDYDAQKDYFTPFSSISFNSIRDLMIRLFDTLPEQQKTIIHLKDIEMYSYEEIAEVTGLTVNTIRVNLSRARKTVRASYAKIKDHETRIHR